MTELLLPLMAKRLPGVLHSPGRPGSEGEAPEILMRWSDGDGPWRLMDLDEHGPFQHV